MYGNYNYTGSDLSHVQSVCSKGKIFHIAIDDLRIKSPIMTLADGRKVFVTGNNKPLVFELKQNLQKTPRGWFVAVRHFPRNMKFEQSGFFLYDLYRICHWDNQYYYIAKDPFPPLAVVLIFLDKITGKRIGIDKLGYVTYYLGSSQYPVHDIKDLFYSPTQKIKWFLGYKQGLSRWGTRVLVSGAIVAAVTVAVVASGGTAVVGAAEKSAEAGVKQFFSKFWGWIVSLGSTAKGIADKTKNPELSAEQQKNLDNANNNAATTPDSTMDELKIIANQKLALINEYLTNPQKRQQILDTMKDPEKRKEFLDAVAWKIQQGADAKANSNMANLFIGLGIGGIVLNLVRLYIGRK